MSVFASFLLALLLSYVFVGWIVPKSIAFYFRCRHKINLSIGRICFLSFQLFHVLIDKNNYVIYAKKITLRSRLFHSDGKKLLTLRIDELVIERFSNVNNVQKYSDLKLKILTLAATALQYVSISIDSLLFTSDDILKELGFNCIVRVNNIHFESVYPTEAIRTTISLLNVQLKNTRNQYACQLNAAFQFNSELQLDLKSDHLISKLTIVIDQSCFLLKEELPNYFIDSLLNKKTTNAQFKPDNVFKTSIVPKSLVLKVKSLEVKCCDLITEKWSTIFKSIETVFSRSTDRKPDFSFKCNSIGYVNVRNTQLKSDEFTLFLMHQKNESTTLDCVSSALTISVNSNDDLNAIWCLSEQFSNKNNKLNYTESNKSSLKFNDYGIILNGSLELKKVLIIDSASDPANSPNYIFFNCLMVKLEQKSETHNYAINQSNMARLLFSDRHWKFDFYLESLGISSESPSYCSQGKLKNQIDGHHIIGTQIFISQVSLRLGTSIDILELESDEKTLDVKCHLIINGLRLEINQKFFNAVVFLFDNLSKSTGKSGGLSTVSLKLKNCNFFIVNSTNCNLAVRVDALSAVKQKIENRTQMNIVNIKIYNPDWDRNRAEPCFESEQITLFYNHIKFLTLDHTEKELSVQFAEDFHLNWSANFHLRVLEVYKTILEISDQIMVRWKNSREQNEKSDVAKKIYFIETSGVNNTVFVSISENHNMTLVFDGLILTIADKFFHFELAHLRISIDNNVDIFETCGFCWKNLEHDHGIKNERKNTENFELEWNPRTWFISFDVFKAVFPYQHTFAEAVHNELMTLIKWLKINYKNNFGKLRTDNEKEKPPAANLLPPDLVIIVREFLFEMSDDPFEIRLRDNYELLEDEFKENLKRRAMLDAKIEEFLKVRLRLPVSKINELYENLTKKNDEIYIQRSKQMYVALPARTRLFAWSITNLKLLIMIDPSILGRTNEINLMRKIDSDTPWPDDDALEFSTIWARAVWLDCSDWRFELRDFLQPLLVMNKIRLWGFLIGAEELAPKRSKRSVRVDLGEPWGSYAFDRNMTSMKYYHDFNCKIDYFSYAFGPCWEPVVTQCNMSFEKILSRSKDTSKPLPFWDKMRLLYHGRLTTCVKKLVILLHASLDPYNTTEEMELTWSNIELDWVNMKIILKGDLDVLVRTASKYDDCRLLHLPNVRVTFKIQWICLGDPNDHHSVYPCAPDKLPEYSSNQEHDSFRAFRSQNLNVTVSLETKMSTKQNDYPTLLLYGSTLRWIEKLKLILSGVTRPTRRGAIFSNLLPRKIQLSRHYKKVRLLVDLHKFQIFYWMSFAMQRGFELVGDRLSLNSEHILNIIPILDGLKHRPKAEWSILYMICELNNAELWLKSAASMENSPENTLMSLRQPVEKFYFLSVSKVSYGRETMTKPRAYSKINKMDESTACGSQSDQKQQQQKQQQQQQQPDDKPTHHLVVHNLKGAWTKNNRNVVFALYDSFLKIQQLKKNLSKDALKAFKGDLNATGSGGSANAAQSTAAVSLTTSTPITKNTSDTSLHNPLDEIKSGQAAAMLQRLIAEMDSKLTVFSDDLSSTSSSNSAYQQLQGLLACQKDDVFYKNWSIILVNSQVVLKGCETKGYVILSASKAEILQRIHRPVWKECTLVSKTTWVGSLDSMQYYATVNEGNDDSVDNNIMWLTINNIQEKDCSSLLTDFADLPDLPHIVGSGQSVGGVVSESVGATGIDTKDQPVQLQRIVSRCKCEFFYASYGTINVDFENEIHVPLPLPLEEDMSPWEKKEMAIDAFTLMHHDLDVCTNSLQYAMILDVVNNLLLYVEPRKKEALERLARMRFRLQLLHSSEDPRKPIQNLQNEVRVLMIKLKRLEKDTYLVNRALFEDPSSEDLLSAIEQLEKSVYECKEDLNDKSEELEMMVSCFKESQLLASNRRSTKHNNKPTTINKVYEICFKHAQWRLTEADGQLGIADLVLSNFSYTKTSKSDDSVEHLLELGYLRMTNLLPNQIYKDVLFPTEIQSSMPVDHKKILRIFCREKPPVGGISVKEHFEVNIMPITIGLTKKFYNTMMKFCFPERDPENIEQESDENEISLRKNARKSSKSRETNFYVNIHNQYQKDVEKMKERAEKNKLFIYIKIPQVPARVSYKGNKEKNFQDIRDFSLVIPTLEYHNVTWTWLDLFLAMKSDTKRVLVSQAIRQKLKIKRSKSSLMISKLTATGSKIGMTDSHGNNDDDDGEDGAAENVNKKTNESLQEQEQKAKLLFGPKVVQKSKKGF